MVQKACGCQGLGCDKHTECDKCTLKAGRKLCQHTDTCEECKDIPFVDWVKIYQGRSRRDSRKETTKQHNLLKTLLTSIKSSDIYSGSEDEANMTKTNAKLEELIASAGKAKRAKGDGASQTRKRPLPSDEPKAKKPKLVVSEKPEKPVRKVKKG